MAGDLIHRQPSAEKIIKKENLAKQALIDTYELNVHPNGSLEFKRNKDGHSDMATFLIKLHPNKENISPDLSIILAYNDSRFPNPTFSWGFNAQLDHSTKMNWFYLKDTSEGLNISFYTYTGSTEPAYNQLDKETQGKLGKSLDEMTQIARDGIRLIDFAKEGFHIDARGYNLNPANSTTAHAISDMLNSVLLILPDIKPFFGVPVQAR